jgi:hypothetical protein
VKLKCRYELCLASLLALTGACTGCITGTKAAPQQIPVVAATRAVRMDLPNDVTLTAELQPTQSSVQLKLPLVQFCRASSPRNAFRD